MKHYQKRILKKMGFRPSQKVLDNLDEKELYEFNTQRQKIKGNKEYDYFEITEPGCSEKSIFDYKNIKEWDEENFKFQEKSRKNSIKEQRKWQKKRGKKRTPKYKIKDYTHLYMIGDWFRALEISEYRDGKRDLIYGQLESANSYVYIETLERLQEEIEKVYPYIYARPYNKPLFEDIPGSKYSRMSDMEKRAAGKEKELAKAEKKLRYFQNEIEQLVLEEIKNYSGYTFRKVGDGPIRDNLDNFIIGGFDAAENINFKTFFYDFYERLQPVEVLDNIITKIVNKYKKKII